ncbi:MAG: hypothetical protein O3A10_14655, partial [Chloroflexi bacterium]|nr:hypothetical protein [Chloroflexota bacterium]
MLQPRTLAEAVELAVAPEIDRDEYLGGYGLLGLQFDSGHLLAMRRVPVSSYGPAYTSLWHRDPAGDWTIYLDVPPFQGCPRYFGSALKGAVETPIDLNWTGDHDFSLSVPELDLIRASCTLKPRVPVVDVVTCHQGNHDFLLFVVTDRA